MRLVQRYVANPSGYLIAAVGSLATVVIIVAVSLGDFWRALTALATIDWGHIVRVFIVVAVIGLSGVISYRSGLWNIGQEGQAVVGALAAIAASSAPEALIAALLAGATWITVPTVLRIYLNINEAVTTFMFMLMSIHLARFFVETSLRDITKRGFVVTIEAPYLTIYAAVIITALVVASVYLLYKSRTGLYLRLLSSGEEALKYAGVSPRAYTFLALLLSGALAGLGGALEIMTREAGRYMTLQQVSTGFGLYGISAAWLGALHPLGTLAASLYIAWLHQVAINLKVLGLPALVANALVGSAMAWGLAGYVMYKYRLIWR
ncbi:MAG: ABC transporter permease [Pyrobaculum sp.]